MTYSCRAARKISVFLFGILENDIFASRNSKHIFFFFCNQRRRGRQRREKREKEREKEEAPCLRKAARETRAGGKKIPQACRSGLCLWSCKKPMGLDTVGP